MVNPATILDGLATTLADNTGLKTVLAEEVDLSDTNSNLPSPFGEVQFVSTIRSDTWNTDRTGYVTDQSGNRIGRLFTATFDAELQCDVYVAAGDDTVDTTDLGYAVQRHLRRFDTGARGEPVPDSGGSPISDVVRFSVRGGERADDLSGPSIRRWRQPVELRFTDTIDTTQEYGKDDYIASVDTPAAGDFSDNNGDTDATIVYRAP